MGDNRILRAEAAERRAHVVELVRAGLTYADIGKEMGFSRQRAYTIYREAVAAVLAPAVEAHRAELLAELAEARQVVRRILTGDHPYVQQGHVIHEITGRDENGQLIYGPPLLDVGPNLDAARTLATLSARESRLTGAEAPTVVQATVTEVTQQDVELAEMIAEAKAANAVTEEQLRGQV